ncbi:Spy/CpxP family protein refolding chaperone [Paucibacter sp. O1-1]|nr:Spy/CpxP family protein refolding chaperone [Paucibacter sp. O1-1]MDA3824808.1 Spy/CpxP family protein refolding chaperone [Paucibacter sp. O1-1]
MSKFNPKSLLTLSALAAVLSLGALSAQAGGHHDRHGMMGGGPRVERMLELVDASEAQRSEVKQIMRSAAADLKPQHEALRKLRAQGQALLTAPSIDAAAVESQRQQAQALHDQISKRMSQALVAAANVLTPEQRGKLAERMAKRQARMAEHRAERTKAGAAKQ